MCEGGDGRQESEALRLIGKLAIKVGEYGDTVEKRLRALEEGIKIHEKDTIGEAGLLADLEKHETRLDLLTERVTAIEVERAIEEEPEEEDSAAVRRLINEKNPDFNTINSIFACICEQQATIKRLEEELDTVKALRLEDIEDQRKEYMRAEVCHDQLQEARKLLKRAEYFINCSDPTGPWMSDYRQFLNRENTPTVGDSSPDGGPEACGDTGIITESSQLVTRAVDAGRKAVDGCDPDDYEFTRAAIREVADALDDTDGDHVIYAAAAHWLRSECG